MPAERRYTPGMTDPTTAFARRSDAFLAEFFRLHPLHATAAGMHAYDADWPDLTAAGRTERLAFAGRWEAELAGFADEDLSRDERVDRDLLLSELDGIRFAETELRQEAWDPLEWIYLLGGGIFPLLAREFAPLADRLASAAGRLEGIRGVVEAARTELVGLPGRPVSAFHTETALKQLSGIAELADDAVAAGEAAASTDPEVAAVLPRVQAAAADAKAALAELETHLREVVLPRAEGEGRLGDALFTTKMRHTLKDAELTPARILARAEQEYGAVRAEMIRLARDLWPTWGAGTEAPADDGALVRAVLDAIAAEHPPAADLLDWCRAELGRIEAFCRDRDLVGLADDPLEIRWTPVFLRAFGGAMLDTPGPLDKGQKAFFAITPVPEDWTPEQAESYLREDNDRMLRVLTIHEAVPGHYLQGSYANRNPSIVRGDLLERGLRRGLGRLRHPGDDGRGLRRGRSGPPPRPLEVLPAGGDQRDHRRPDPRRRGPRRRDDRGRGRPADGRGRLPGGGRGSQQVQPGAAVVDPAVDLLRRLDGDVGARARRAEAAGRGRRWRTRPAAVVERALPGGLGETPGFVYRPHLEAVMGHGALPPSLLRRVVLDEG